MPKGIQIKVGTGEGKFAAYENLIAAILI